MFTRFETPRLIVRRLLPEDANAVFEGWAQDPEVTRYLSWPVHQHIDETRAFLRRADHAWKSGSGHLAFGLQSKETGELLGGIGYGVEDGCRAQVGYALRRAYWGRGYASEALTGLIAEIWKMPHVHRIYGFCHAQHYGSAGVMRKVGMELEGVLRKYYILPNLSPDQPCDMACYSMIKT